MSIPCESCDGGTLQQRKKYRLGGFVAFIGYALLIPVLIGVLWACIMMVATRDVVVHAGVAISERSEQHDQEMRRLLVEVQVSEPLIEQVINLTPISDEDLESLPEDQQRVVKGVQMGYAFRGLLPLLAQWFLRGLAFVILIASIIGSLLGWILVMKKRILQCGSCGAVMAAS